MAADLKSSDVQHHPVSASAMEANKALFGIAIAALALELFGACLGVSLVHTGALRLTLRYTDIPLIFGLIVLFVGNYNYYLKVVAPSNEPTSGLLLSLCGMLFMAAIPFIIVFEPIRPWRFWILTSYGVVVVWKNAQLVARFRAAQITGPLAERWRRRAIVQTAAGAIAGMAYYSLIHEQWRYVVLDALIEAPVMSFRPAYDITVDVLFNCGFLFLIAALYFLHHGDIGKWRDD